MRELLFVDDSALVAHSAEAMQKLVDAFSNASKKFAMRIDIKKTEVLYQPNSTRTREDDIMVDLNKLISVLEFTYLGIQTCHIFGMAIRIFDLKLCKNPYQSVSLIRLPVNWPKLFRPFQNVFSTYCFDYWGQFTARLLTFHFTTARLNCVPQFVALDVERHFL